MKTIMMMITTTTITRLTQLWDLIEACGFHKDIKDIINNNNDGDKNDNNDEKNNSNHEDDGISALGLDKDLYKYISISRTSKASPMMMMTMTTTTRTTTRKAIITNLDILE